MFVVCTINISSCRDSGENFVGKWVDCKEPSYSCTIILKDNVYSLHDSENNDFTFEKKTDEILSAIGSDVERELTLTYDKKTNRLIVSEFDKYGKEINDSKLCKSK